MCNGVVMRFRMNSQFIYSTTTVEISEHKIQEKERLDREKREAILGIFLDFRFQNCVTLANKYAKNC